MVRVLIHTPVSNRAWVLPQFLDALAAQIVPAGIDIGHRFDINDTQDNSREIILQFEYPWIQQIVEHPWSPLNLPDHQWNAERYSRMILLRNNALREAKASGAHFLFSIDSDVILDDPDTLAHLLQADVPVIAGVFMAKWGNPLADALPNVWQRGQNEMSDEFVCQAERGWLDHIKVGGLGACTLIRRDVWETGVNYDPIYNLPSNYRGEDRHFCIRAAVAGIPLQACSHMKIRHVDK